MRFDQFIGLNKQAKKIVGRTIPVNEKGVRTMPDGTRVKFDRNVDLPLAQVTVIGGITGAYTEPGEFVANLHRYTFPSGVVYEEYVQCSPWCGGPMYFIALRRPSGKYLKTTVWPSKETKVSEPYNNSANS
jgi:hypothetical protein